MIYGEFTREQSAEKSIDNILKESNYYFDNLKNDILLSESFNDNNSSYITEGFTDWLKTLGKKIVDMFNKFIEMLKNIGRKITEFFRGKKKAQDTKNNSTTDDKEEKDDSDNKNITKREYTDYDHIIEDLKLSEVNINELKTMQEFNKLQNFLKENNNMILSEVQKFEKDTDDDIEFDESNLHDFVFAHPNVFQFNTNDGTYEHIKTAISNYEPDDSYKSFKTIDECKKDVLNSDILKTVNNSENMFAAHQKYIEESKRTLYGYYQRISLKSGEDELSFRIAKPVQKLCQGACGVVTMILSCQSDLFAKQVSYYKQFCSFGTSLM